MPDYSGLSLAELQTIVNNAISQIPGEIAGTNGVLLYSGNLGDAGSIHSAAVASAIAEASQRGGGNLAVIDNTSIASILNDSGFQSAVEDAVGGSDTARRAQIDGFWDSASQTLAANANGPVTAIAPNAALDRIFVTTELPELLDNPNVTHINGIPRETLAAEVDRLRPIVGDDLAIQDAAEKLRAKSYTDLAASDMQIATNGVDANGYDVFEVDNVSDFANSNNMNIPDGTAPSGLDFTNINEDVGRYPQDVMGQIGKHGDWLKNVVGFGGAALDILDGAITAHNAYELWQAGDTDGAVQEIVGFGGSLAGGWLAAAGVLALVGSGPVGLGLALVASVGGGLLGEDAAEWLYDNMGELWGGATQGLADFWDAFQNFWNNSLNPPRDPLIVDLGPSGISFKSMAEANVFFDMDNDGNLEATGWLTGEDGFVAIDENGNGVIDNVGELIGDPGQSGFEELATYDSNNDGQIDSSDAIWTSLRIWRDLNEDGITDTGELQSLSTNGIASFGLDYTTVNFTASENLIHEQGAYETTDGAQRLLVDVWLQTDNVNTMIGSSVTPSPEAAALPTVRGYGDLPNLQEAMTLDSELLSMVEDVVATAPDQLGDFSDQVEALLYQWAGTQDVDPDSRGGNFDGRKLATMEAVSSTPWITGTNPNPPTWAVGQLNNAWNLLIDEFTARFLAVGPLADVLQAGVYSPNSDTVVGFLPLADYADRIDALAPMDPRDAMVYWEQAETLLDNLAASQGASTTELRLVKADVYGRYGLAAYQYGFGSYLDDQRDVDQPGSGTVISTRGIYLFGEDNQFVEIDSYDTAVMTGAGSDYVYVDAGRYAIIYTGAGSDVLAGSAYNDYFDGGAGTDHMTGYNGNDTYVVDHAGDTIVEATSGGTDTVISSVSFYMQDNLEYFVADGTGDVDATGNAAANRFTGNDGVNAFTGLAGNDIYYVGAEDTVVEQLGEGNDYVYSSDSYTLSDHVERLYLQGEGDLNGTGNDQNNYIYATIGDNIIDGRGGNDYMYGYAGDDIYFVDSTSDRVYESADSGFDEVFTIVQFTNPNHVEKLTLVGTADVNITGNAADNLLIGNQGNNTINGSSGADTMQGGAGDDSYLVDNPGDVVIELADEGHDSVSSLLETYVLPDHVEDLTGYHSNNALIGTGNALDNLITGRNVNDSLTGLGGDDTILGANGSDTLLGGDGNDSLNGGSGADDMRGGDGDDIYIIDNAGDIVTEDENGGNDTIVTNTSIFNLQAEIENITISSTSSIDINGNEKDNVLTGNTGANTINGLDGDDTMIGGRGNDTYTVNSTNDRVVEYANEGTDEVRSSIDYALGNAVEHLILTGTSAVYGSGTSFNNRITGNAADNIIFGGTGADTMTGGAGSDTYLITEAEYSRVDRITDFATSGDEDNLDLSRLLTSFGYTGSDAVSDQVLRFREYSNIVSVELNFLALDDTTTSTNWRQIVVLENTPAGDFDYTQHTTLTGALNSAPFVVSDIEPILVENGTYLVQNLANGFVDDFDDETLTWELQSDLPDWLNFNVAGRILFGVVPEDFTPVNLTFVVSDSLNAATPVTITVTDSGIPTDISLTPGILDSAEYGNKFNGAMDADGVITAGFISTGNAFTLSFKGFDIDSDDEVEVLLNGVSLGLIGAGVNNGLADYSIEIPATAQLIGENVLTFQQVDNIAYKWGITDLLLTELVATEVALSLGELETGSHGNKFNGSVNLDGIVTTTFDATGSDLNLDFEGYDIDNDSELEVLVNGVSIGTMDAGVNNGLAQYSISIAAADQVEGENTVAFMQTGNPNWKWGVTNLLLSEVSIADIILTTGVTDDGEYGNKYNGAMDADGEVTAAFSSTGLDVALSFKGYDIDYDNELEVLLNGTSLGMLAAGNNNGLADYSFVIAAGDQAAGDNIITFKQLGNPNWKWGVTDILVSEIVGADINLTKDVLDSGSYGNKFNGTMDADGQVTAGFVGGDGDLTLQFKGYDIDSGNELELYLNGVSQGLVEAGVNNGLADYTLEIAAADQSDGLNVITFEQAQNIAWKWGITDLMLIDA